MSGFTGPIKEIAEGIFDGPHATPPESEQGPVFLGIKNVTSDGRFDFSEIRHISDEDFPKWTKRVIPRKDDIVFSYEATLHRYALIPPNFIGCLGRRMALIRPNQKKVIPRFLYYYFQSRNWYKVIDANIISGATVDRIPIKKFPNFEISIPGLSEQMEVANILGVYDDLIENNKRRIHLLEKAARLIYKEWFVHFRFPGHEHTTTTNGIPNGWLPGVIKDFYKTTSGGTPNRKNLEFYTGDIKWVKTKELLDGFIFDTEEHITLEATQKSSAKVLPEKTVLIAMYGATIGQVGILANQAATNQACCAILPCDNTGSEAFIFLFFLENKMTLKSLSQGAAQNNISQQVIRNLPIILPSSKILELFSEIVSPILRQIKIISEMNLKLVTARDILLPRLMNGDIQI